MHFQSSGRVKALFLGCLICVSLYIYVRLQYPSFSFRHLVYSESSQSKSQESDHQSSQDDSQAQPPSESFSKEDFVAAATRYTMAVFESNAIDQFCAHDSWESNRNVAVNCERIFGGIGNLRQRILACLHHAMKEGSGFIIPPIELRNFDDLIELESSDNIGFEYIFDRDVFVSRLSAACPRMTIYDSLQSAQEKGLEIYTFPTTMAKYAICQDSPSFAANFGQLLVFPPVVYRLAFTALYALESIYMLPISPSPLTKSSTSAPQTYLALHLRTAIDAVAMGWSSYEVQSQKYLDLASSLSYTHIYVASGNLTSVSLFSASALALSPPRTVLTKDSLLSGPDLQEMQALTWDQLALIDYVMLESAGFFAGVTESSFSWNIAAKRRALATGSDRFCDKSKGGIPEGLVWDDTWSLIYGTDGTEFGGRIWP